MEVLTITEVVALPLRIRHSDVYLGTMPDGSAFPTGDAYTVRPPWRSLYSPFFETLLVRIVDADGVAGWGEALAPIAPEVTARVVEQILAPILVGSNPTRVRPLMSGLKQLMRERGHLGGHQADALAAVDIALWDLAGKRAGLPVHQLLGGAYRSEVPTYISGLPRASDDERAALAAEWVARGVTRFKLHLGMGVRSDLATFDAIAAVDPSMEIAVDAHWAYQWGQALTLGRELDARGALFYEAPLAPEDLAGHAALAADLATPVAVGEALRHRYEFAAWIGSRALGIVQPDVGRVGITELMTVAEIAGAYHLPIAPHHSMCVGPALLAGLHVSAAVENLLFFEFQPTTTEVSAIALKSPPAHSYRGFVTPGGVGLGSDVDIDALLASAVDGELVRQLLRRK